MKSEQVKCEIADVDGVIALSQRWRLIPLDVLERWDLTLWTMVELQTFDKQNYAHSFCQNEILCEPTLNESSIKCVVSIINNQIAAPNWRKRPFCS